MSDKEKTKWGAVPATKTATAFNLSWHRFIGNLAEVHAVDIYSAGVLVMLDITYDFNLHHNCFTLCYRTAWLL